jgi:hypothetical protein
VPNKTIYVSVEDLPIWEAAQSALEKRGISLSTFLTEYPRKHIKEISVMDGFLHVFEAVPEAYAVSFAPRTAQANAAKVLQRRGLKSLTSFLRQIGLNDWSLQSIADQLEKNGSASERVVLPEDRLGSF